MLVCWHVRRLCCRRHCRCRCRRRRCRFRYVCSSGSTVSQSQETIIVDSGGVISVLSKLKALILKIVMSQSAPPLPWYYSYRLDSALEAA